MNEVVQRFVEKGRFDSPTGTVLSVGCNKGLISFEYYWRSSVFGLFIDVEAHLCIACPDLKARFKAQ
jgi:hypothetical protein